MATYTGNVKCKNCGMGNWVTAEKGTTLKEKVKEDNIKCRDCDCSLAEEE